MWLSPKCFGLFLAFLLFSAQAQGAPPKKKIKNPSAIQTHWTTLGGMEYLQDGKKLSGEELKSVIGSLGDSQAEALLRKSESDETWGFLEIGGSIVLGTGTLFFKNDMIHVVGLNISTPYLPLAIPGAVLGVIGGLQVLESSTSKYAAVQRYNHRTHPDSVTWGLSPMGDGMFLAAGLSF